MWAAWGAMWNRPGAEWTPKNSFPQSPPVSHRKDGLFHNHRCGITDDICRGLGVRTAGKGHTHCGNEVAQGRIVVKLLGESPLRVQDRRMVLPPMISPTRVEGRWLSSRRRYIAMWRACDVRLSRRRPMILSMSTPVRSATARITSWGLADRVLSESTRLLSAVVASSGIDWTID